MPLPRSSTFYFLVDIFAVNDSGDRHHVGGGRYIADTPEQAMVKAKKEHWSRSRYVLTHDPDVIIVHANDPSSNASPGLTPEEDYRKIISELDSSIPF